MINKKDALLNSLLTKVLFCEKNTSSWNISVIKNQADSI